MAAPAMQEGARVRAGPAGLVVEHDDGRTVVVHTGAGIVNLLNRDNEL